MITLYTPKSRNKYPDCFDCPFSDCAASKYVQHNKNHLYHSPVKLKIQLSSRGLTNRNFGYIVFLRVT